MLYILAALNFIMAGVNVQYVFSGNVSSIIAFLISMVAGCYLSWIAYNR